MSPLALTSPEWALLEDAYGSATEVPNLLSEIEGNHPAEALGELEARICHQASVYSSTIAAFPHLVEAAVLHQANPTLHVDILCVAGAICESRELNQVLSRSEHRQQFSDSLPRASGLAASALNEATDQSQALYLLKAVAAFTGFSALARLLDGFLNDEFTLQCPSCSRELYVWPCAEGFFVAAEDPVMHKQLKRTFVSPGSSDSSARVEELRWLQERVSGSASLSIVSAKLPYLFGEAVCPKCATSFPLFDRLLEQSS